MTFLFQFLNTTLSLFIFLSLTAPIPGQAQSGTVHYDGAFLIIINDLIIVDDQGKVSPYETKQDANLNIQAKIKGVVRADEKGTWHFKQGQTIQFLTSKMYLTNEITVPVTLEVLVNELDKQEETIDLPVLIKGKNDTAGHRFKMRINGNMLAGKLLKSEQ
ncbi:MAG: hypothetical protein ACE5F7_05270 [Nitrospiria bacterium]